MNKLKFFLENFLIYGVGGVIGKIIPVVMIPIITRLMPDTSSFGISDMCTTVVSFGSALAIMGMYDAMYRMFFEKNDEKYKKEICSTTLNFTVIMSLIVFVLMIVFKNFIAVKFLGDIKYGYLVYITAISTLVGATNSIVAAPTRMQNKRKIYLFMNVLTPLISYSIAIPMILKGYYIEALPVSTMVANISSELVFLALNRKWFTFAFINKEELKQLLKIAVPLLPNFLIYWVFNSSDKLMITNILGTGATGIYSVGAKLGQASQLIYTAFAGGWQFFAFSTMKEENQVKTNSLIFEYLGVISFACTAGIFLICQPLYNLLFQGEYVRGYIVSPYLFLAPLLQMLFQIACNQFLVIKKTWPNLFILSTGAVVNVILNLVLIPQIGIEGAAIATLVGYLVSDVICVLVLMKMKLMVISRRFVFSALAMIVYILIWRLCTKDNIGINLIMTIAIVVFYIILFRSDLKSLIIAAKGEKNETA